MLSKIKVVLLALVLTISVLVWHDNQTEDSQTIDRRSAEEMADARNADQLLKAKERIEDVETLEEEETLEELETSEEVAASQELESSLGEEAPEKFFYHQLDARQQSIYRELRDGILQSDREIQVETDDANEVYEIFKRVLFDHPEIFWVTNNGEADVFHWSDGSAYTVFEPEYIHTGEAKEEMQAEIDEAVEAFLADVDPELPEYELVRLVYEHIISTTEYNLESTDNQNIYSVFVNQESICAGFSKAAQLLLSRLGIFATYVVGEAYVPGVSTEPIPHAWNLVRVYGEYYFLDVTWGSPVFQESSGLAHRINVLYDYLLVNEEKLFRTHSLREGIELPPVTSLQHNFFVMHNMFHDTHDPELVLDLMNDSIWYGDFWIAFKFATPELFQSMREVILEELAPEAASNLAYWYELDSVQYFVREKENLNKLTVYWVYE